MLLFSRLTPQTRTAAATALKFRDFSCSASGKNGAVGGEKAKKKKRQPTTSISLPSTTTTSSSPSASFSVVEAAASISSPPRPFDLAAAAQANSPNPLLQQLFGLRGACVVITGGGGAIGSALALGFASCGAAGVAVVDRDGAAARLAADDAARRIGESTAGSSSLSGPSQQATKIIALEADATDTAELGAAVASAASAFGGRITTLVASVGELQSPGKGPHEMTDDEWERSISVNAGSVFKAARACYPYLKENSFSNSSSTTSSSDSASSPPSSSSSSSSSPPSSSSSPPPPPSSSIVVLGSIAGRFGYGQQSSYCAAKGAALSLARSLAVAWAPAGVRVNVVSPGPTASAFTAPVLSDLERVRATIESIPSGRLAVPEDFVAPVLFLSGEGARFVTGAEVVVDGGATAHTAVAPPKPAH